MGVFSKEDILQGQWKGLPKWPSSKEPTCRCNRRGVILRGIPREEEMATHCSTPAGKIPWTEKLGGLRTMVTKILCYPVLMTFFTENFYNLQSAFKHLYHIQEADSLGGTATFFFFLTCS